MDKDEKTVNNSAINEQTNLQTDNKKSNSHSKAVAKYNAKRYNTFTVNMKKEDYKDLEELAGKCGVSKARIMIDLVTKLDDKEKECLISEYNQDE